MAARHRSKFAGKAQDYLADRLLAGLGFQPYTHGRGQELRKGDRQYVEAFAQRSSVREETLRELGEEAEEVLGRTAEVFELGLARRRPEDRESPDPEPEAA